MYLKSRLGIVVFEEMIVMFGIDYLDWGYLI